MRARLVLSSLLALAATGCRGVRSYEKAWLAEPAMQFEPDPQGAALDDHVLSSREGAEGGTHAGGGGCGCD